MIRTWLNVRALVAGLLGCSLILAASCGPNMYWGEGKRPGWLKIDGTRLNKSRNGITAIGSTPATTRAAEDQDLAERDARTQISNMLSSEVKSRQLVWTMQVSTNDEADDEQVVRQDVEVTSNLRLEDAKVASSWRDEETKTVYVLFKVDTPAWASRIKRRLAGGLAEVESMRAKGTQELRAGKGLRAYRTMKQAYAVGARLGEDARVMDVLATAQGYGRKVARAKQELDDFQDTLLDSAQIEINVSARDSDMGRQTRGGLEQFLKALGLKVVMPGQGGRSAVKMKVEIGHLPKGVRNVGRRTEHLSEAMARLRVIEPDGSEVRKLSVDVSGRRYTERGNSAAQAAKRATALAARTVQSRFRSKFRRAFAGSR